MEKLGGFEFWRTKLKCAKYVVAPMVDQSELAWRMLSRKYGAELCYTPMLHSSVFVRDQNYRTEALQSCPEDRPLIIQFCANHPETFLKAAQLAEDHCDAIDLNLGCPQLIAKKGHYGAFLQDEWELLQKMVSLCHEKLKVPITCKVRVFDSIDKTIEYAKMLEKAGCQLLTVHGRVKEQKGPKTGLASWKHIRAVRENVNIPVYANGNIQYLPDVDRCMKETGVHGVMSAEGNLHNPALFKGTDSPIWQMAQEYLEMVDRYPCPLSYARGHIFKIFHHGLTIHLDIREIVATAKSLDTLKLAVLKMKERCLHDIEKFNKSPETFKTDLPLPYWMCQPYVRPSPEEEEARRERREAMKRTMEVDVKNLECLAGLSKNKQKKKLRNPHKSFDGSSKTVYEKCEKCLNPKGKKCAFGMCKNCCKEKTWSEILDCVGHGIFHKSKMDVKKQCDAKIKEIDLFEKSMTRVCQKSGETVSNIENTHNIESSNKENSENKEFSATRDSQAETDCNCTAEKVYDTGDKTTCSTNEQTTVCNEDKNKDFTTEAVT